MATQEPLGHYGQLYIGGVQAQLEQQQQEQLALATDPYERARQLRAEVLAAGAHPSGRWSISNVVDNLWTGVRQGALLDNLIFDDPEVNAASDLPVVRIVGLLGGAIGEGALTQSWLLRGVQALAKASKVPRIAATAARALVDMLEGSDVARRVAAEAMLAGGGEAALQVAAGRSPKEALSAGGLAGVGASVFGGVGYGLLARRALKAAEPGEAALARQSLGAMRNLVNERFRYEHAVRGVASNTGLAELSHADDYRALKGFKLQAATQAADRLRDGIAKRLDVRSGEWDRFHELVTAAEQHGKLALGERVEGATLEGARAKLDDALAQASPNVRLAFEEHKRMLAEIAEHARERFGTGGAAQGDLFAGAVEAPDFWYAQQLADMQSLMDSGKRFHVQFLRSGAFLERAPKNAPANYLDFMHRALVKTANDRLTDEFVQQTVAAHGVKLSPEEALRFVKGEKKITLADGTTVKQFNERPGHIYPTWAVHEAHRDAILRAYADNAKSAEARAGGAATAPRPVEPTPIWGIEEPPNAFLPEAVADRLTEELHPRDIFEERKHGDLLAPARRLTAAWKRNTIWWGLSRFFGMQVLGDAVNAFRSTPQIFAGGREAPAVRALEEIFAHYKTPLGSRAQAGGAAAGAALGATTYGLASDDPNAAGFVGAALAGAGLGYGVATSRAVGTAERALAADAVPLLERYGARSWYELASKENVLGTGFVAQEEELARRVLGASPRGLAGYAPASSRGERARDTVLSLLAGKVHGDPAAQVAKLLDTVDVVQTERENWLRLASFIQRVESGVDPRVAGKQAREALVDYGKFTDFEDKYLRGFLLPFYAFTRHNTANWARTLAGRDVGGYAKPALLAAGALAGVDVAAQAWNSVFFPEVEKKLDDRRRAEFHVIMGNPFTGEAYQDANGRAMVFATELGYEPTLELMGLARPGYVLNAFGAGLPRPNSLLERALNIQDTDAAPEPVREALGSFADLTGRLLSPALRVPMELAANRSWLYDAPIVPDDLKGTPEEWTQQLDYIAEEGLRQYREWDHLDRDATRGNYNPLNSAFGLGLPVDMVDLDMSVRRRLHNEMQASEEKLATERARWAEPIDEMIYSRSRWDRPAEDEPQRLSNLLALYASDPRDREAAVRYYVERTAKSSVLRHWNTLNARERAEFVRRAKPGDLHMLAYYVNGGEEQALLTQVAQKAGLAPPTQPAS